MVTSPSSPASKVRPLMRANHFVPTFEMPLRSKGTATLTKGLVFVVGLFTPRSESGKNGLRPSAADEGMVNCDKGISMAAGLATELVAFWVAPAGGFVFSTPDALITHTRRLTLAPAMIAWRMKLE